MPDPIEVLKAYEAWEADVILHAKWGDLPTLTQAQWDRLVEIQAMRNAVLYPHGLASREFKEAADA